MSQSSPLKDNGFFINNSNYNTSSSGYWEPHTASIDFCESNYLLSDLVVEPHNVWSSFIGLSLFGIVGIIYGNPTRERRTFLIYFTLLVIGLGSACLHATLHWCFQSSDELPMIYLIIGALYAVIEVDSPKNSPKYPHLATYLILLCCANTAIYYTFQHLFVIFFLTFATLTVMVFYFHVQIAWRLYYHENNTDGNKNKNRNIALRFYLWHHISYSFIAFPIWVLDQFHCEYLIPIYNNLPFPLRGMTFHVVWHICAGMGAHFFIQFLCACRADALGMVCDTRFVLGVIPVVIAKKLKDDVNTKQE